MAEGSSTTSSGTGFAGLLTVLFIGLWIGAGVALVVFLLFCTVGAIASLLK